MAGKEIVPFTGKIPKRDELAIVPIEPKPLAVIPLEPLAIVPPRRRFEHAYYAQARQLPSPPEKLLLKDAPKGPKVAIPRGMKLLPPWDNERLVSVKTNRLGEVTCAKYTSAPRVSIEGVRAAPSHVKFIPPKEASKRSTPPLERAPHRPRVTMAMMEERVDCLSKQITSLQNYDSVQTASMCSMSKQVEVNTMEIHNLRKKNAELKREIASHSKNVGNTN